MTHLTDQEMTVLDSWYRKDNANPIDELSASNTSASPSTSPKTPQRQILATAATSMLSMLFYMPVIAGSITDTVFKGGGYFKNLAHSFAHEPGIAPCFAVATALLIVAIMIANMPHCHFDNTSNNANPQTIDVLDNPEGQMLPWLNKPTSTHS